MKLYRIKFGKQMMLVMKQKIFARPLEKKLNFDFVYLFVSIYKII